MRAALLMPFSTALLAGCATLPAPAPTAFTTAPLSAATPSDLPRNARPLHYAITVEPDAAALRFSGTTAVTFELFEPSLSVVMHAAELQFSSAVLIAPDGRRDVLLVETDPDRQTVSFNSAEPLVPGTWRIESEYTGRIGTQAAGLFALDYPDKRTGQTVRGLFTQFEAPDARRFAPMFDEPSYKATFDLSAIVPAGDLAVGNMPIAAERDLGDGRKQVTFATSPQMSSYLLFFATGDFERTSARSADGTELGIVAPTGSGEQARYSLDSTLPMIPWLEDYFGTHYPLPKLDNVAAPGQSQSFGAMENWGAILTFESILLDDPAITSPARRQQIYATLAHEVSHQWFGNIVTMAWWDDLWLNEGFASWLETKVTHHFNPDWHANLTRVNVREGAMGMDAYANTHPVIQPIRTVAETAQAFDAIAYSKGESVIAMLESYAGEDVWQDGLRRYIARHAYANTRSTDLWQAMEEAGAGRMTAIAQDFTTQPGVPLVRADGTCVDGQTRMTFTQSEFSLDRPAEVAAAPQAWRVPLWIAAGQGTPQVQVLEGSGNAVLAGCVQPVLINAGQTGYFRTLYSEELALRQQAGFASLAPIDQLGLLRDAFALAQADYQPLGRALALLEAVPERANPLVAEFAADTWATQYEALDQAREEERARIAALAQGALGPRLEALGFDAVAGEPVVKANLRARLINVLGRLGDPRVADEARRRFALLASDRRALDGPLKTTWLGIAAASANEAEWDLLARLAAESTSTAERQNYFAALGSTRDEALARRALEFALTGEAGTTSSAIITRVSVRHPELAFGFAMERAEAVRALVDPSGWHNYLADLAAGSRDPALLARLEEVRSNLSADEAQPYTRVIDEMRVAAEVVPRQQQALLEWLAARG